MAYRGWRKASVPTVKEMKEFKESQLDSYFPRRRMKLSNDPNPPKTKKELKRKLSRKD